MSTPQPTLAPDSVATLLRDCETRAATLEALDAHSMPIDAAIALAAAPALTELLAKNISEVSREQFNSIGLLLGRLVAEAAEDQSEVFGAAHGDGRLGVLLCARDNVLAHVVRTPAAELTQADVYSYVCWNVQFGVVSTRGKTKPYAAAGYSMEQYVKLWTSDEWPISKAKMPDRESVLAMVRLLLELFRGSELPKLAVAGVGHCLLDLFNCRDQRDVGGEAAKLALNGDLFGLVAAQLRSVGTPSQWMMIAHNKANNNGGGHIILLNAAISMYKSFVGLKDRPDLDSIVGSGLFEECAVAVESVAHGGVAGLQHNPPDYTGFNVALSTLRICVCANYDLPKCERRIRSMAKPLAFSLENDLDWMQSIGYSSGMVAAQICCSVFGRDEESTSDFTFTQRHVDGLIKKWSDIVRATEVGASAKPSQSTVQAIELCISDKNKPLLLSNKVFIPYLVDALLLTPDHPRASLPSGLRIWCQETHVECLAQLACFPKGREALLREASVSEALHVVKQSGLSDKAKQHAESALLALGDQELQVHTKAQKHHVMLSYQWNDQAVIKMLHRSLTTRGYATWFDVINMKGSTMDAMSDAIEGAAVMLYGISKAYKESVNCRLEANYAHQQELDMIPLMMQKEYKPIGWLGLLMGARLWYAFYGADQDDHDAFESRVDNLVREIGDRGRLMQIEHNDTPTSATTPPDFWPSVPTNTTPVGKERPPPTTQFNADTSAIGSPQLSEMFYLQLERERADRMERAERAERAERERAMERERADRMERFTVLVVVGAVASVACVLILKGR